MVLNNIERICAPSAAEFYQAHILGYQPVILTNLFDHAPLRLQDTLTQVKCTFADLSIGVFQNYIAQLLKGLPPSSERSTTVGKFLTELKDDPITIEACSEYPTPPELLEQLPLQHYQHLQDSQDIYSNLFLAGTGNYAHLHYDADQRHVLLYQVFGVKRVVLIHPRHTQKLDPIHRADLRRTSSILLERFTEAEKTDFLKYTHAWDTLLYPGETIFMPAFCWHYLEYLEPSMSVGYRLGRNAHNRRLAALFPAPSIDVQALAIALIESDAAPGDQVQWLDHLETLSQGCFGNPAEQQIALDQYCLEIRHQLLGLEPVFNVREWGRRKALGF
jgi:Cupin-like domain